MESWRHLFYRYVEITDIEEKRSYRFMAGRWLAAHKDDGNVDCMLPVASTETDLNRFSHIFSSKTQVGLTDEHLWWSILLRPPRSNFTRCQRLAVVVTAFLCSMTASSMFYDSAPTKSAAYENDNINFSIGLQQVSGYHQYFLVDLCIFSLDIVTNSNP